MLRLSSSLFIVALTLAASRAEAQFGCWADDTGSPGFACEAPELPCGNDTPCAPFGDSCDSSAGHCRVVLRPVCVPCLRSVDCPMTLGDAPLIGIVGPRCTYRYPCGAVLAIGPDGPQTSDSLCFRGPDRMRSVPWDEGDCDSDGSPNGLELGSTPPTPACVSVVTQTGISPVAAAPLSRGSHLVVVGGRGTGAPGLDVVEEDPTYTLPVAFGGLVCSADRACPRGAAGAQGRCVYVTDTYGVCLYSDLDPTLEQLPREDTSCAPFASTRPLPMGHASRRALDEDDYDGDGIGNLDDPHVCTSLEVVSASGRMLVRSSGELLSSCSGMSGARIVMPESRCAASMSSSTHFGVGCDARSDCPVSVSSGLRTEVRCVQFPGAGICVYGGGAAPDGTCADVTNVSTCGLGDYSSFVTGDCDDDGAINVTDGTMCGRTMSPGDAGIDGGAYADADALDADDALDAADVFALSDAVVRNDTSVRPPPPTGVSFGGGGGCTCGVAARKPGPGSLLIALGLLGAFWTRRTRRVF